MQHLKVGIHARARAGKDTIAKYLTSHHGFIRNAFADPLKRAAQQMFMLTDEQTWSDELKEVAIPYWGMSPRQMFQLLGTEGGRNVFGNDIWTKRWRLHFDTFAPHSSYVTPDVRFENEAAMLRDLGFTIVHVIRPDLDSVNPLEGSARKHASENGIDVVCDRDIVIYNDSTIAKLQATIAEVVGIVAARRAS